ncbi:MAG TPA: hypothetical protein VFJ79_02945 [Acidimicrobiales bacterium]|nr:hypothetical protein [Acidimicrobiales bacterium]
MRSRAITGGQRSGPRRILAFVTLAVGVGLVASACSTGGKLTSTSADGRSAPVVLVANIAPYGQVLTTTTGFVLYTYTADDPGGPGCDAGCLAIWPPLLLPSGDKTPVGGPGVTGLGTFRRGGQLQVTFKGLPLYTFVSDTQPDQVTGQNYKDSGGTWILAVEASTAASATTTVTAPPTTHSANTSPPTTKAAATQPETTRPPATSPPATSPPATSPPATSPPATSPPATNPPGPAF